MSLIRCLFLSSCLSTAFVLTLAACGSSSTTSNHTTEPAAATAPALGTSGMPGLDWGANAAAVLAVHPRATPTDGGLWYPRMVESHNAIIKFTIGAGGLDGVLVEFTDGFVSMDDCGTGWKTMRTSLDGRFGASTADNLAAYWKTATTSITLACNPNESNAGVLSLTYAHLEAN